MTTSSLKFSQDELPFTQEEDFKLLRYAYDYKGNFDKSDTVLGSSHTQQEYIDRYTELQSNWTQTENIKLKEYVEMYGDHKWSTIALLLPGRNSKQCRDHYINQLAPNIIKGGWTAEEDKRILDGAKLFGNSWTKIRSQVPNRSELDIKNRYNKLMRELIDKGRILDINEIIEGVLKNPKVQQNTEEAGSDYKSLKLKLEVTPELLEMQEKIKKRSSTISSEAIPFLSREQLLNTNHEKLYNLIEVKDMIRKVDIEPYKNILVPSMTSDVAKVLSEEAERHIKLQKYSINPYDEFKVRHLGIDFDKIPVPEKSTRKYSHLPKDKYNEMFYSIEIPTPETTSSGSDNNNNNNNNSTTTTTITTTTTDPLLPLFQSSTATSVLSLFPLNSSSSNTNTISNPFFPNPVNKRRKQIETNPYTVDWYCPSCGYKNPPGCIDCKSNSCKYPNPFIDKYQQKLYIQRSEHQIQHLKQQIKQQQQILREQGIEIEDLHKQMLKMRQKLFDKFKRTNSNNNNNKSRQKQKQKNHHRQRQQRYYNTRQSALSDDDDEEEEENNQNILQQQQIYCDDNSNDDKIPYPYDLLEQNIADGKLKPWYCPRCSNKNDLLQDVCSVCNHDNPNRYVNINGAILNKFTLSNIEIPHSYLLQQQPSPPSPQSQQQQQSITIPSPSEDVIMNWICTNCGIENDNTTNTCIKCKIHKSEKQIIIPETNNNNNNNWSCIYCHHKNKNQNDVCESCNNERSYAFQSIDGDDNDEDYYDDDNKSFYSNNVIITNESNDNQSNQANQMEESKSTNKNKKEKEENTCENKNENKNENELTDIHNTKDEIEVSKEVSDIIT